MLVITNVDSVKKKHANEMWHVNCFHFLYARIKNVLTICRVPVHHAIHAVCCACKIQEGVSFCVITLVTIIRPFM